MLLHTCHRRAIAVGLSFAFAAVQLAVPAGAQTRGIQVVGGPPQGPAYLPTGQYITAMAAPGSRFQRIRTGLRPDYNADVNGAISSALSPDGKTLAVLASGYNCCFDTTSGSPITTPYIDPTTGNPSSQTTGNFEWVYLYDVSTGPPKKTQQIQLPNAYDGMTFDPTGTHLYVSGGQDDRIYIFQNSGSGWQISAPLPVLGHNTNDGTATPTYDGGILKFTAAGSSQLVQTLGLNFGAMTAGVAVAEDGSALYAANLQDDSVSVVDPTSRAVTQEIHLFSPGAHARATGEFPYWVTPHSKYAGGPPDKAFVSSVRDGQILVIKPPASTFRVIPVGGEPGKMTLSFDQRRLYVANPDLDEIEVIDAIHDRLAGRISVMRPGYRYRGATRTRSRSAPTAIRSTRRSATRTRSP
jgi:YVTN family beta-propeller protein